MVLAVLMAGGEGARLRPLTYFVPKPLIPIAGRPCIDYVLASLAKSGVTHLIITTCYGFERIAKHVGGTANNMNVLYSIEDEPLGTAGGVKKVANALRETFIVASADVVADVNFESLLKFHKRNGADVTMALTAVDKPWEFGIVELDENDRIVRFKEKPKPSETFSNTINAGIYVLEPHVLEHVPEGEFFDFSKNLFPVLLKKGYNMFGKKIEGYWKDIGRPSDAIQASAEMAKRMYGGEGNYIASSVKNEGSTVVASSIYENVRLGKNAEIKRSIILANTVISDDCSITDSILCGDNFLGKGCVVEGAIIGRGVDLRPHTRLKGAVY